MPTSNSPESFRPSQAYWKEVEKLDNRILTLSRVKRFDEIVRRTGLFGRAKVVISEHQALWHGEDQGQAVSWNAKRSQAYGVILPIVTSLSQASIVRPHLEATPDMPTDRQTIAAKQINYSLAFKEARVHHAGIVYSGADHTVHDYMGSDAGPFAEEQGLTRPIEEDYDQLLEQLKRGASGEFAIVRPEA